MRLMGKEMHDLMVKKLPAGCRLTAIFDCCHSGSALSLPYEYVTPSPGVWGIDVRAQTG